VVVWGASIINAGVVGYVIGVTVIYVARCIVFVVVGVGVVAGCGYCGCDG